MNAPTPRRPEFQVDPPSTPGSACKVVANVLVHMEEIMGPGPVYSLTHFGAIEEGRRLALEADPGNLQQAVMRVSQTLGVALEVKSKSGGYAAKVMGSFPFQRRGVQAFFVGLLEGAVSTVAGKKVSVQGELVATDNELRMELV